MRKKKTVHLSISTSSVNLAQASQKFQSIQQSGIWKIADTPRLFPFVTKFWRTQEVALSHRDKGLVKDLQRIQNPGYQDRMQYKSGSYVAALGGGDYYKDESLCLLRVRREKSRYELKGREGGDGNEDEKDQGCELWDSKEKKFWKVCSH